MQRYDSYKDSGVKWLGEIPSHWEMKPGLAVLNVNKIKNTDLSINTVLSLSYGKIVVKKDINEGLVPAEYDTYQVVHPGYIIIRCTDLQNDKVSLRTGLVKNDGIITNAYLGLIVNNKYNYSYIHYFLHAWDVTKEIYRHGSGLRQSLSWLDLRRLPILLPSQKEQEAIANYLDSATSKIDEAIAQQQKMIDLLNERKQIIINNAVTKGLDPNVKMKPSGIDWIGDIPEHWHVVKTSYIFNQIGSGTTPKSGQEDYYSEDGMYFLQTGDLNNGYIDDTSKKITEKALRNTNLKIYPRGSLVIAMYGATIGKLGILNIDTAVNQACCVLPENQDIITKYAFYCLMIAKNDLILQSRGGGQPNISQDTIKNEKLIVPPLIEQKAIVNYVDKVCIPIQTSIDAAKNQISLLQERKQIIINDVVTGKVKVI